MKFWDSSAIVPLVVQEQRTENVKDVLQKDPNLIVWWATELECLSAIARLERDGHLGLQEITQAIHDLQILKNSWNEVQPMTTVREIARRLLRLHPLRTADSLQLAAAVTVTNHQPQKLPFVCQDQRLSNAARKEGFTVIEGSV